MAIKITDKLLEGIDLHKLPQHIAIIMDGNGRWAKKKHRPRLYGHRAGANAVREVVEIAGELMIPYLTVYAFSTENWNRPKTEVSGLMKLLIEYLNKEMDELNRKNVNVRLIGSRDKLDSEFLSQAHQITSRTWKNTGLHFSILFNYGSKQELVDAIKEIAVDVINDKLSIDDINIAKIPEYLYTKGIPDPDLVIRTSGEMRLSNFLIWQTSYSELYITETLWPDFDKAEFIKALKEYQRRTRRFGGTVE